MFNSKLAIAIVAAALLTPFAAKASETSTGATAAAVSIKFNDCSKCGQSSGSFSITPGGNTTGGGTGVRELSAAVATGETSAKAQSSSSFGGTSATASGYSKPVTFEYVVIKKTDSSKFGLDTETSRKYEKEAAIEFAKNSKDSKYSEYSKDAAGYSKYGKGKKGYSSESGYETSKDAKSGSASEDSKSVKASYEASGSESAKTTIATENNSTYYKTGYTYSGPSSAIKHLPAAK